VRLRGSSCHHRDRVIRLGDTFARESSHTVAVAAGARALG
jgi:hypothetical protein